MLATESVPTVSTGIQKLREVILENTDRDNIYGSVANGTFPLVVNVQNEVATTQYSFPIPTDSLPVRHLATDQNQARFPKSESCSLWWEWCPTCKSSPLTQLKSWFVFQQYNSNVSARSPMNSQLPKFPSS